MAICCFAGLVQADQRAEDLIAAAAKLKELATIPVGLEVTQSPDPVRYVLCAPSLSGVRWNHSTTVSSLEGPVKILEFGYFVKRNGQWESPYGVEIPHTYSADDFAKKYNCTDSELQPGKSYTDEMTQSVIDCVPEQMVMWYFIGQDEEGNMVKGESSVMLITELKE